MDFFSFKGDKSQIFLFKTENCRKPQVSLCRLAAFQLASCCLRLGESGRRVIRGRRQPRTARQGSRSSLGSWPQIGLWGARGWRARA